MPLVSAADWLNSQSADRLNIRSADWPVPRSSGDITQADQPTLQKPSAPSPLIQDTTHTTYSHTNNHTIQHTRTINNTNIKRSPATFRLGDRHVSTKSEHGEFTKKVKDKITILGAVFCRDKHLETFENLRKVYNALKKAQNN